MQYTVANGTPSDKAKVTAGIPQGSVLGPALFSLYTYDLPGAIKSAMTFIYADNTTICCIGDSVDKVIVKVNMTLMDLTTWCKQNSLIPQPKKCEGTILKRKKFTGPLPSLVLNGSSINWMPHSRLLGITVDDKFTWTKHFRSKLSLLKQSLFLPRSMVLDLYNKVILPSITYALPIWVVGGGGGK